MDFMTHLPRTLRGHEAVWVIVDWLTKSAHFLAVRMTFTLEEFGMLHVQGDCRRGITGPLRYSRGLVQLLIVWRPPSPIRPG